MGKDGMRSIDVDRVRAETVGLNGTIHLNSAGASPSPDCVVDAVTSHLHLEQRVGAIQHRGGDLEVMRGSVVAKGYPKTSYSETACCGHPDLLGKSTPEGCRSSLYAMFWDDLKKD
jgi:hypothetical protein